MSKKPLILVTNDDGINAPGIQALIEAVKELGEVIVVAPEKGQSGMGHAITISDIVRLNKVEREDGITAYSSSGTPVDCVKLAICHVLHKKPDLVVSGINHGANSSINVIYSGTMSAAVEGSMEGIPSIGFSHLSYAYDTDFLAFKKYIQTLCKNALNNDFPNKTCLNVNFPDVPAEEIKGVKICRQAEAHWSDSFEKREDPSGKPYYWLTGNFEGRDKGEDTDIFALANKYISVVPVQFDLTAHHVISELNTWDYND
jgi:5'-nucleotidase